MAEPSTIKPPRCRISCAAVGSMSQKPSAGAQSSLIRPHGPSGRSSEPSDRAAWPQLTSVAACVCAGDDSCTAVNAVHCAEHGSSSDDRRASGSPSQRLPDWMKLASMSRAGRPSLTLLSESTTVDRGALRLATCATRAVYAVSRGRPKLALADFSSSPQIFRGHRDCWVVISDACFKS